MDNELKHLLRTRYPQDDKSFETEDYLFAHGSPLCALAYRELFWPTFVEIDGMVFWQGNIPDSIEVERVRSVYQQYRGDVALTEKSFNFIEVAELFLRDPDDVSQRLMDDLVRAMCETWKARLQSVFPEKHFVVDFVAANEHTGEESGLLFYQSSAS